MNRLSAIALCLLLHAVVVEAQEHGAATQNTSIPARQIAVLDTVETLLEDDRTAEALTALRALAGRHPDNSYVWFRLGQVAGSAGLHNEGAAAFRRSADFVPYAVWGLHNAARLEARAGDVDAAIASLRIAHGRGYADFAELSMDPDLASLRNDARFVALMDTIANEPQPRSDRHSSWSPDGRQIVFASSPRGEGAFSLFIVDSDGKNLRRLTSTRDGDLEPTWSPDGEWIAFTRISWSLGTKNLVLIRPDGSELVQITGSGRGLVGARVAFPDWSPDSRHLAVRVMAGGTVPHGVWVINADGSDPRPVTGFGTWPNFLPDGNSFVMEEDRAATIRFARRATALLHRSTTIRPFAGGPPTCHRTGERLRPRSLRGERA